MIFIKLKEMQDAVALFEGPMNFDFLDCIKYSIRRGQNLLLIKYFNCYMVLFWLLLLLVLGVFRLSALGQKHFALGALADHLHKLVVIPYT